MALVFFFLAGRCGFAFLAVALLAFGPLLGLNLSLCALLDFTLARFDKRYGAGAALVFRQSTQDNAGTATISRLRCRAFTRLTKASCARPARRCCRRGGCRSDRGWRGRLGLHIRLGLTGPQGTTFHFLDNNRFGAAVREALTHHPLFDGPFQGQRLGRGMQRFFACGLVVRHSALILAVSSVT